MANANRSSSSPAPSASTFSPSSPRLYELDWLRTGAIALVVLYHCGMFYNTWGWHIKTADPVAWFQPIMIWMHQWRMPLLLFISGIGTCFLLKRRSLGRFIWERHNRLMIPLLFGMLVIVPPQIYVERAADYASYAAFYPTVFEFKPYPMGGSFSWHHLWFILYLFAFSLVCLPLLAWFKSPRSTAVKAMLGRVLARRAALASLLVPLLLADIWLRKYFPDNTHGLIDDWAGFTHYALFFLAGYLAMSLDGIWAAIKRDRHIYTGLAVVAATLMELMYFGHIPSFRIREFNIVWGTFTAATSWFTVLAVVGWAQVLLRRQSERVQRWNEASYPVYILHQTVIIVIAQPLEQLGLHRGLTFTLMFAISLVGSYLLYHHVIRHFAITRVLFGLKARPHSRPRHVSRSHAPRSETTLSLAESQFR